MTTAVPAPTLLSSVPDLQAFLAAIPSSCTLDLDLEGKNLCRHGTIAVITVLVHPQGVIRLIDVHTLGKAAFTTAAANGRTLQSLLEDPTVPKCLWDVRNDADALWALYQVGLAGVIHIQLLENACRTGDKTYIRGLDKCIQKDLKLGFMELNRWIRTKKEITSLMSTDIFAARPMETKTAAYCSNDVVHLPALHKLYLSRISPQWLAKTKMESTRRVHEAQSPGYLPQSPTKKLGPWGQGTDQHPWKLEEVLDYLFEENDDVGF